VNPGRTLIPDLATAAVAEHLEALFWGQIEQLLILTPPGTLKSYQAMVAFPAWTWIDYPSVQFVCAAGSQSNRHRDSIACRNLILTDLYQKVYVYRGESAPRWRLREDQNAKEKFENTMRGWRDSATAGETIVGRKADILLGDDLMDTHKVHSAAYRRNVKDWFDGGFWNRVVDEKNCRRAVIGQHVDTDDLQTHLIRKGGWTILRLRENAASRPERNFMWVDPRKPGEFLRPERHGPAEQRAAILQMTAPRYETQHQQNPKKTRGSLFPRDTVRRLPIPPAGVTGLRYWDIASSKEESACNSAGVLGGLYGTGENKRFVFLHMAKGHWEPDERNLQIRNECIGDLHRTGLEYRGSVFEQQPAAAGKDQSQGTVRYCAGLPVSPSDKVTGDKFFRAEPLSTWWKMGLVDVVEGTWTEEFLDYMEAFERGAADNMLDVGDAASGCFNRTTDGAVDVDPAAGDTPGDDPDADPYAGIITGEEASNANW
jgi:predicted phage terminase large subunit-like protein